MAGLHSLTEEALIEARNWANRAQWCAHELLDEVLSDESLRILQTDRLLFLESRWHLRKQTLASPFLGGNFEAEAVFQFIRDIGEKRGRPFCYSGCLTKCALDSATCISENVAEIIGPPLTNWKSETVEEIGEAINELRSVIRWNPTKLESELSEECEFAIANLRTWKAASEKVRLRLLDELDSLRNPKPAEIGQTTSERHVDPANNVSAAVAKTPSLVTPPVEHDDRPSTPQSKTTRTNLDWLKLVPPPVSETWHRQELIGDTVAEIMRCCDTAKRSTLQSRNGKALWLMRTADNKIACYFRSETEYAKANLRKLQPPKKSEETETNQKRPKQRESAKHRTKTSR